LGVFRFFIDGYGAAGNSLGGRLLGAKDYSNLWLLTKRVVGYNLIICVFLMLACTLFYKPIGALFSNEADVLEIFGGVFFMIILMQPVNAVAFTVDSIFKGLGEMKYLRNTLIIATFIGFLPTLYITKRLGWGLLGIWLAFMVWMLFRASILMYYYKKKYYKLAMETTR